MSDRSDSAPAQTWLLALSWSAAVLVVAALVGRFWIPLDDGTLAQSAERVLAGQLPHRDFDDPYSGLNAVIGAVAFRLFGVSLASLRIPLVVGFAAWLPALWMLNRRFAHQGVAWFGTALAALLSVLTYPAAMPTWFALFAVTWGLVLFDGFLRADRRSWLAATGAAAGIAVLFKVVGLYFLAACLLTVAWHRATPTRTYLAIVYVGCASFLTLIALMVLRDADVAAAYHFFLPAAALCSGLVAFARGVTRDSPGDVGPGALVRDGAALLGGFALPIGLFLTPYLLTGAVAEWLDGVFLRPGTRLESASSSPAAPWTVLTGVAAVTLAALTSRLDGPRRRRAAMAVAGAVALGFALDDLAGGAVLSGFWYALRTWIPALVVWGAWVLARRREPLDTLAFAALATAGLWALVQFPYPAPAYVFYVAPLGVVATLAVVGGRTRHAPTPVLGVLAALFAFLGAGYAAGVATSVDTSLALDRGGIVVTETDARTYEDLTEEVRSRAGEGGLWAGPDAPEVYFLSGIPNRTPVLYEFLSGSTDAPTALTDPAITVVVLNERPLFSRALSPETTERLMSHFPESRRIGDWVVRWRSR